MRNAIRNVTRRVEDALLEWLYRRRAQRLVYDHQYSRNPYGEDRWAFMSEREKIAALGAERERHNVARQELWNGLRFKVGKNAALKSRVAALEAERENRKKTIPDLPFGIEQAQYIVAHADEYIDLAVHLASWALELHAQIGELHAGFGRTESAETATLRDENAKMREKVAALEAEVRELQQLRESAERLLNERGRG